MIGTQEEGTEHSSEPRDTAMKLANSGPVCVQELEGLMVKLNKRVGCPILQQAPTPEFLTANVC